jgi:hypothetical protein
MSKGKDKRQIASHPTQFRGGSRGFTQFLRISSLQNHKQALQLKLQERHAELRSKVEQLAQEEQVQL